MGIPMGIPIPTAALIAAAAAGMMRFSLSVGAVTQRPAVGDVIAII